MTAHGPIRAERPTPSRAKLIALLIEERAKVIHYKRGLFGPPPGPTMPECRDQARREIEAEELTKAKP